MGERFPTYFIDWLCVWRALHDETYEAPADIKARAEGWERDVLAGKEMSEADRRLSTTLFAELTVDEFKDVVRAFKAQPAWGFKGMTYGEKLLVVGGDYDDKNLKTNKVISIEREIGKHPVLAFGNSGGDMAMGNYTLDNPHYKGAAFMLLCDNTELDYGDLEVAADFAAKCEAAGFTTVSMAHDWTTIYGEGVVKAPVAAEGELPAAA